MLVAPDREEERPLTWHEYPCEWDAATSRIIKLKEFGELVYNDLLASVTAQFGIAPEQKEPQTDEEKFDEENSAMEAFVEERTQVYVPRVDLEKQFSEYVTSDDHRPLVLSGTPGIGKSAILVHWVKEMLCFCGCCPAN